MAMLDRANTTLNPDRELLNTKFEHYKIHSGGKVDITYRGLENAPHRVLPSDSEYSYQITRYHCLFNHLFTHPLHSTSLYTVVPGSNPETLVILELEPNFGREIYRSDFQINTTERGEEGITYTYNASVFWSSAKVLLLSYRNEIHHIDANKGVLVGKNIFEQPRMLLYAMEQDTSTFILTCHRKEQEKDIFVHELIKVFPSNQAGATPTVNSHVCCTFHLPSIASFMSIQGGKLIILHEGKALKVFPLSRRLEELKGGLERKVKPLPNCKWVQTSQDVEVTIPLPKGIVKTDLVVDMGVQDIEVRTHGGQEIFKEKLFGMIEPGASAWQMSDDGDGVTLHLSKYQEAHNWACLTFNPNINRSGGLVGNISEIDPQDLERLRARISSLDQYTSNSLDPNPLYTPNPELEECDELDGKPFMVSSFAVSPSDYSLTHEHLAELSPSSFVCSFHDRSFYLRHSVDMIRFTIAKSSPPWRHTVTHHAASMIQSSKTQKKFIVTDANSSYFAIVDMRRNVYVYKGGPDSSSNTGRLLVITLDRDDTQILGAVAAPQGLHLLTEQNYITVSFDL